MKQEKEYQEREAANWSILKYFERSPAHAREAIKTRGFPPSDAQKLGTITHDAVLSPKTFSQKYFVLPP